MHVSMTIDTSLVDLDSNSKHVSMTIDTSLVNNYCYTVTIILQVTLNGMTAKQVTITFIVNGCTVRGEFTNFC